MLNPLKDSLEKLNRLSNDRSRLSENNSSDKSYNKPLGSKSSDNPSNRSLDKAPEKASEKASTTSESSENSSMKRILISCMIGNAIEWYDFALYGFFASLFGKLFFPSADPIASLMASFGVFSAGFIMRPMGALFFGYVGDKFGRTKSLVISIYMMAIPTALIAFLPTYNMVGWISPLLLTCIRLVQGFSMGGEFTGSMVFVGEHSPADKKGFYGSWIIFSVVFGTLLGSFIAGLFHSILDSDQLLTWGWRVPFIISVVGAIIGGYMRKFVGESDEYLKVKKSSTPIRQLFSFHKKNVLYVMLIDMTVAIGFFLITIFIGSYLSTVVRLDSRVALTVNTIGMFGFALTVPIVGLLIDKLGKVKIMSFAATLFCLFSVCMFSNFFHSSLIVVLCSYLCLAITMGIYYAPLSSILVEIFPADVRYSGVSISHNLSMTIFGGTAPIFVTFLMRKSDNLIVPGYYLMGAAVISLVGLFAVRNKVK